MLPDGPPVLGPSGAEGVWLNLGHGGSGWALACGSARLVAESVAGRPTPIGIDGLGIERLWGRRESEDGDMSTIRRLDASSGREPLFGVAATRRIEAEALRDAAAPFR